MAVGDAAAPGRVTAAPEAARLHELQLLRAEELALHQRDEKAGGLLGVGDDGAFCADARVRRGHVRKRAAGGDGVAAGVLARDGALGVVRGVAERERLEDPLPVERLDASAAGARSDQAEDLEADVRVVVRAFRAPRAEAGTKRA